MTTHPAPDPFVFDLRRLRIESMPSYNGRQSVKWSYLLPNGVALEIVKSQEPIYGGGGGSSGGRPEYPFGLPTEAHELFHGFQRHVAGLSAHQRMAWAAAAMKEASDA